MTEPTLEEIRNAVRAVYPDAYDASSIDGWRIRAMWGGRRWNALTD